MSHNVIGEGTYGCVLQPGMKCDKKENINYSGKVSKVMLQKHAEEEYKEMRKLSSYKGLNKYIISMPHMCKPKIDTTFLSNIKKCENEKLRENDPTTYRMLVLDDAGITIEQFVTSIAATLEKKDMCIFLSKIFNLLEGLCVFHDYRIIHHDIHMRNIVYNIKTGAIKFIDFGFIQNMEQFVKINTNNKNKIAQSWFNFPPEYKCANKKDYDACGYTLPYEEYVKKLTYTFDWYSFGLMMQGVIKELYSKTKTIPRTTFERIHHFFTKMAEPNIELRNYNINTLPTEYKRLLQSENIWLNEKNIPAPSIASLDLQKQLSTKSYQISKSERKSLMNHVDTLCTDGFVFNNETRKCFKKCKPGYVRNKRTNRCRKVKRPTRKKKN